MGAKELIIQTALEIIGQEGVHKITTREIAKRANVNSSALNYHFGTKDNLIRQAMEVFIGRLGGSYASLYDNDKELKARLLDFLKLFADISVQYPGVTKSLVEQMMWLETSNPVLVESQKKGVETFTNNLMSLTGIQDEQITRQLGLQMMAAVIYPVLISKQLPNLYHLDYREKSARDAYIELLFHQLIFKKRFGPDVKNVAMEKIKCKCNP